MRLTEIAVGKCPVCSDQLLSIPGRTPEQPRRIICPICTANELEWASQALGFKGYKPTPEETERMGQ